MAKAKWLIHNRIRELRDERNRMSQQELADDIGVSRQTVNAIEGGKYSPSLDTAFAIARALGTTLDQVFRSVRTSS